MPELKPLRKLDKTKDYYVRRIGDSTPKVTKGKVYIVKYRIIYRDTFEWVIDQTDNFGEKTQPVLRVDSNIWQVMHSTDRTHTINKEITPKSEEVTMSELKNTSTGRIINGTAASKYSDTDIIRFIVGEKSKLTVLATEVGKTSKYYITKAVGINADLKLLKTELDSRVA
jgi:hypothetical protein